MKTLARDQSNLNNVNRNPNPSITPEDPFQGINLQLLAQLLPRQSPRWCYLSLTLWSLIALDTQRNPDLTGLLQFLEVIDWRAHGKITEDEFSVLFGEWIKVEKPSVPETRSSLNSGGGGLLPTNQAQITSNNTNNNKKKTSLILNISIFRCLLLEKNYYESDLDLFIGIIIHESNLRFINTTISYVSKTQQQQLQQFNQYPMKTLPSFTLEVVTRKWLELSEELFFSLDTPGYGSLRYDEAFFFCCCVSVGFQSWNNEIELETDLSLTSMTAVTLQFMRDAGATVNVQFNKSNYLTGTDYDDSTITLNHPSNRGNKPSSLNIINNNIKVIREMMRQEITLPMFKRYLIQRNVGEVELSLLLQHIKTCIERLARLAHASGAEDLYQACQPYEHKGNVIGSPKLFQEAVLFASGFQPTFPSNNGNIPPLPSILLFLLSDAEKYLSGFFRAIEFDVEGIGFTGVEKYLQPQVPNSPNSSALQSNNFSKDLSNPLITILAANEELHDNAKRLYAIYRVWMQDPSTRGGNNGGNRATDFLYSPMNPHDLLRDPSYQLIVSTLLHYKRLQQILNAAFYDFSLSTYGANPAAKNVPPNTLSILCASLLSTAQLLLVEFGLSPDESEPEPVDNDEVAEQTKLNNSGGNSSNVDEFQNSTMHIDELNQPAINRRQSTVPTGIGASRDVMRRQSTLMVMKEEVTKDAGLKVDNNKQTTNSNTTTAPGTNPTNTTEVKVKPAPNYLKTTQTFVAKTVKERKVLDSESADSITGVIGGGSSSFNEAILQRGGDVSDPDISKAKWQSLLDVRATSPSALPTPPLITSVPVSNSAVNGRSSANPPTSAAAAGSGAVRTESRGRKPDNMSGKDRKARGLSPSALVLSEDESKLLAQLLVTNNVQEQHQLIEKLRTRVAALPITADSNDLSETDRLNVNMLSPLSMSPRSPPITTHRGGNVTSPLRGIPQGGGGVKQSAKQPASRLNGNSTNRVGNNLSRDDNGQSRMNHTANNNSFIPTQKEVFSMPTVDESRRAAYDLPLSEASSSSAPSSVRQYFFVCELLF